MASYYPEGECFFVRSSLKYSSGWTAENTTNFYGHFLLEYQWNGWAGSGSTNKTHPRSSWKSGYGAGYGTRFCDWDRFWVGETKDPRPDSEMLAISSHPNSLNWNEMRDRDDGGPRKYILRPIPIRSSETQWLWIDGTVPIRAIYFPLCQKSDEAFPDYCTYLVIDFRARKSLDIVDLTGKYMNYTLTAEGGLGRHDELTWGFKIPDIITYLSLPRQLRNPEYGLYSAATKGDELVVRANYNYQWWGATVLEHVDFYREIDYAKIISATFGVEVGWRPYHYSSFILDLVESLVEMGLGFIPGAGPLLSVAFGIGVQLLEDPNSFSSDNILELGTGILETLIGQSGSMKKYLAPEALQIGSTSRSAPPTDEERAARKVKGDELNARLTESIRKRIADQSPMDTDGWQKRFADLSSAPPIETQNINVMGNTRSTETGGTNISVQISSNTQQVSEAHLRFK